MSKNGFLNKRLIALLLAVGAVIITVAYVVGATISRSNAKKSYARTLDYMKEQCISYIEVTSSDEVKSLVRLTEQADVIRTDIDRYTGGEGAALLQEYIDSQRLAGAVITDGSLDPVIERHNLGSGYDDWENIIRSTYVSGVMGYPQKIYSERINKSDGCYDIAAVSRTDGDGVVFCYRYQNSAILESNQDPLKNMLAGY